MNTTKDESPPFSRIFIVCDKQTRQEDLVGPFSKYGEIENIFIPRDRNSGETKGVAYVQYSKTSSAAAAVQALHLKTLENMPKPIKVMIATNKNENFQEDKYKRLFIKVPRDATEPELTQYFAKFGSVDFVRLQKDKNQDARGFAYVKFNNFLDAAKALEECDKKYKPVFATPKEDLIKNKVEIPTNSRSSSCSIGFSSNDFLNQCRDMGYKESNMKFMHTSNKVYVTCSPMVPQKYIEKLFNVIPGMSSCNYNADIFNGICKATVTYDEVDSANLAIERLHNFEFPSGEIITVKPETNPLIKAATDLTQIVNSFKTSCAEGDKSNLMQLADVIAQASSLIQVATSGRTDIRDEGNTMCSVPLPPSKPLSNSSKVAQRCFIVCKPYPPPISILSDIFSRFGDLIVVSIIPNKIFGFVKYASKKAAQDAIRTLDGAIVCGSKLTVVEADEKQKDDKMSVDENYSSRESKRIKLDSN